MHGEGLVTFLCIKSSSNIIGHSMISLIRYDIMYYYIPQSHPKQQMIHFYHPPTYSAESEYTLYTKKKERQIKAQYHNQSPACLPACLPRFQ